MAIQVRKGNEADFDVNKMLPAEFAVCTDTGKVFVCTSAGNTKELASVEELQGILGASDEAYQAFQELMEQMDNDTVVTGLLADVSNLKTGNYTISFFEPEERGNIEPSDTVKTIFGKIRKVIADLAAVSFSGKYSSLVFTDIESVTAPSDENTMILDSSGTPQKITWANVFSTISDGIKAKILEWTFANLTTTNKTLPGAINELNTKISENVKIIHITLNNGADVNIQAKSNANLQFDVTSLVPDGYYLAAKYPYIRWYASNIVFDISFGGMGAYNDTLSSGLSCYSITGGTANLGMALICIKR